MIRKVRRGRKNSESDAGSALIWGGSKALFRTSSAEDHKKKKKGGGSEEKNA